MPLGLGRGRRGEIYEGCGLAHIFATHPASMRSLTRLVTLLSGRCTTKGRSSANARKNQEAGRAEGHSATDEVSYPFQDIA